MTFEQKQFAVVDLVNAWKDATLRRNEDYQRGSQWTDAQKKCLLDSVFRGYPIPPLFLQPIERRSLGGVVPRHDVVDGQQRLLALHDYYQNKFELYKPEDRHLRIPKSLRSVPAPWGGFRYNELPAELRTTLDGWKIDVFLIHDVAENSDEVRDLFIRLQSGTALSRQQVRDAWPGNIGPYVWTLAGKLSARPKCGLFRLIDRRGIRMEDEETKDQYVSDRQTCAQMLRIFLARCYEPSHFMSISAAHVDTLYHEFTEFDTHGPTAERFEQCLELAKRVLEKSSNMQSRKKRKFRKLEVLALVLLFQDLTRNPNWTLTPPTLADIVDAFSAEPDKQTGKATSGRRIEEEYEALRKRLGPRIGVTCDERRVFNDEQKQQIKANAEGMCAVCGKAVQDGEDEYDHFPIPWRDGGRTDTENGRLVHERCHPRGRPRADDD